MQDAEALVVGRHVLPSNKGHIADAGSAELMDSVYNVYISYMGRTN